MNDGEPDPERLPRRSGRTHLEPQLREPGGAGTGTPFAAFDPDSPDPDSPDPDSPDPGSPAPGAGAPGAGAGDPAPAGSRAAAFRAAVRRATGRPPREDG
ncbi:hypothetical protein [Pseudonocardia hydrocarbonoxydans]|uniref:hypothetical protein n=1 Tax=Pseudonocardia hydrocarbonoxydans TaxID=76726 RepID=UPI001142754F|nr:hypothetical protein [Pseudonocardia hydrocarbonoxydans]